MVNRGTVARANRYLRNEPNFCLKYQTFACKFFRAITEQKRRSSPGVRLRLQGRVSALAPCRAARARASSISLCDALGIGVDRQGGDQLTRRLDVLHPFCGSTWLVSAIRSAGTRIDRPSHCNQPPRAIVIATRIAPNSATPRPAIQGDDSSMYRPSRDTYEEQQRDGDRVRCP